MNVTVGDFKRNKYGELTADIRQVIMDFAAENHLALVEALGILEVIKIELYDEQIQREMDEAGE